MGIINKIFNREPKSDLPTLERMYEPDTPVRKYADILIYNMVKNEDFEKVLKPDDMPVNEESGNVDYKHVLNRIKVMANLNPFPSKEEVKGTINLRVAGVEFYAHITVAPNDEFMQINIKINP